jgi:RES domain-containing protein
MVLWRLSGHQYANVFDGGYGLLFDGRWNTVGHAITYCATSPSLCVLEKLVHIEDPALLPELIMVTYEGPDTIGIEKIALDELPSDWRYREGWTQAKGDEWYEAHSTALLQVPSVVVPLPDSPDVNLLINHNHPAAAEIRLRGLTPFAFDTRLF